jgi:C-terminal processing protease CtpA/Prc
MRNSKYHQIASAMKTLLAVSVCAQGPLAAWANDDIALLPETPHTDAAPNSTGQEAAALSAPAPTSTFLYGRVKQRNKELDGNADANAVDANASASLQAETPAEARTRLKAAAYKKLSQGFDLTSDEYRSLGVGCIGYESLRTFFQTKGKITAVYKNSPASKAGLKVGETIIQDASDNEAKADPTIPLWSVSLAKEGDPVDVMVVRHGHKESLTILRYNIEDIEEPAIRAEWEKIVRDLGFPKQGTFNGRSMNTLKKTSDEAL